MPNNQTDINMLNYQTHIDMPNNQIHTDLPNNQIYTDMFKLSNLRCCVESNFGCVVLHLLLIIKEKKVKNGLQNVLE